MNVSLPAGAVTPAMHVRLPSDALLQSVDPCETSNVPSFEPPCRAIVTERVAAETYCTLRTCALIDAAGIAIENCAFTGAPDGVCVGAGTGATGETPLPEPPPQPAIAATAARTMTLPIFITHLP